MKTRRLKIFFGAAVLLVGALPAYAAPASGGIGMEQEVKVALDRGDYLPKAQDDRTPLMLRLEGVTPGKSGGYDYVFRYIGFEPGTYRLADYLVRPDGSPATSGDQSLVVVKLDTILPENFQGELVAHTAGPFGRIGGYRRALAALAALWLVALPALLWLTRRKKPLVAETAVVVAPTYAERLRPLVEAAAEGRLDAAGQAALERLLTGYWREKLGRPELRMAESLAALKEHPEAGALLLALERWLHRPGGVAPAEIDVLLKPYGRPSPVVASEGGVA